VGSLRAPLGAASLSFRYPSGPPVLQEVDLEVAAGEVVALLGPNGAGKSTLLRLAAGDLRPTRGELRILGTPAPLPPAVLRRVGYAPPRPVHFEALSGKENARFFARASGLGPGPAGERVSALLSTLSLDDASDRRAGEYSDGMRRKLLLIEALAPRPEIVLLDEALAGLDPPSARAAGKLLRRAAGEGAAVLLATQDVREARHLADRIVFLDQGRKVADAPPDTLLAGADDGGTVEVVTDRPLPLDLKLPPGVSRLDAGAGTARFAASGGSEDLPALLGVLVQAGSEIREIRLREPDLADVFLALTGRELTDDPDGGATT